MHNYDDLDKEEWEDKSTNSNFLLIKEWKLRILEADKVLDDGDSYKEIRLIKGLQHIQFSSLQELYLAFCHWSG